MEKIGNVTLDDTFYPGEDFYCDGTVEDEILEIVKNHRPAEFPAIIEEKGSWPILYHLSALRENIVNWLPMDKSMKVLEVGSGCGAITGCLARKAGSVVSVDLSKKRSLINAYRHAEYDNLRIMLGNFKDVEPALERDFDYICLIGVLEYGKCYIDTDTPFEDFIKLLQKHLKQGGRIVIAIENRWGLKYWAGCREDHLGTFFSGLEDYQDGGEVRTFTRKGLEQIFAACGVTDAHFYYPYPDYKFMEELYSDERLPRQGELTKNVRNFDRDRLQLFDEKRVFDSIIREELFPLYSNSYLVVLGEGLTTIYSKFSNDRSPEYAISTRICQDASGDRWVEKHPLTEEAWEHVESIGLACTGLKQRFAGSGLSVNSCTMQRDEQTGEPYARLEYLEGRTLAEYLDDCLDRNDMDGFQALFQKYLDLIGYRSDVPVVDYDLIFPNILIQGKTWTVIDYEWTFGKCMDPENIAFRALYCYVLEDKKREKMGFLELLEQLSISEGKLQAYREEEMAFQKFVTGERLALGEIRERIGNAVYPVQQLMRQQRENSRESQIQIYVDRGQGFREADSAFLEEADLERDLERPEFVTFTYPLERGTRAVRIDPCMHSCLVWIKEITLQGVPLSCKGRAFSCNGKEAGEQIFAFATQDPNLTFGVEGKTGEMENILKVTMEVTQVSEQITSQMGKKRLF